MKKDTMQATDLSNQLAINDLYTLAHDIKSPVNQIKGLLDIASSSRDLSEKNEMIIKASTLCEKLNIKILRLLTDTFDNNTTNDKTELYKLLNKIKDSLIYLEGFNETKFIFNIPRYIIFYGEFQRLESVLLNILENSIKYRKCNQNIVIVTASQHNNQINIKVRDNGIGIKKENVEKVFERTFQEDLAFEGTGNGLYLAKKNLLRIGGNISLESEEGVGSIFSIDVQSKKALAIVA